MELEYIQRHLKIDESSPSGIAWLVPTHGRFKAGSVAGSLSKSGYYYFKSCGRQVGTHRLVWILSHPDDYQEVISASSQIDHRDGDKLNNIESNMRKVTQRDNMGNLPCHREGHLVGTKYDKSLGKWIGRITIKGKTVHLGVFDTKEEAHKSYLITKGEL